MNSELLMRNEHVYQAFHQNFTQKKFHVGTSFIHSLYFSSPG